MLGLEIVSPLCIVFLTVMVRPFQFQTLQITFRTISVNGLFHVNQNWRTTEPNAWVPAGISRRVAPWPSYARRWLSRVAQGLQTSYSRASKWPGSDSVMGQSVATHRKQHLRLSSRNRLLPQYHCWRGQESGLKCDTTAL